MYNFGNKSSFDYDEGLKILLRFDESDDFYYNLPLQGAQVCSIGKLRFKLNFYDTQSKVCVDSTFDLYLRVPSTD